MKNKYLSIFLMSAALVIAGCGGKGGSSGKKVSLEQFEEALLTIPQYHPYVAATISYDDNGQTGRESYTYYMGWNADEGSTSKFNSVFDRDPFIMVEKIKDGTYDHPSIKINYTIEPFSIEIVGEMTGEGITYYAKDLIRWNEHGLPTYTYAEEKEYGAGINERWYETLEITYRTAGGDTSAETSQSGQQSGNTTKTSDVTEAEWNAQFLLDSQQNYAFQVTGKHDQYEWVLTGSYDAGKIYYTDGAQAYYYNILWNTVDSSTRTGNVEYYRYESGAWYKSTFTAQRIDDLSEATLRVPFTYSNFTYNSLTYTCPSETVFGVTFGNIEVSFSNKKISLIRFEVNTGSYDVTYEGIYSGYGQQRVTLPEATSGDTSAAEPLSPREAFRMRADQIDYAAHPFKTAYVSYETFDTYGSNSGEQTFTWNPTDKVWFSETSSPFSQLPTANTFIPEIESMEKQYGFTFDEKWGGDLKTVTMFGKFDQQGVTMYITVSAEFNDYGYATYYGMSAQMTYEGQEYSSGSAFTISFAE